MSEFGGLWKQENNQHALVPPKTECGCPSGEGMKNSRIRYTPPMEERRKKIKIYSLIFSCLALFSFHFHFFSNNLQQEHG